MSRRFAVLIICLCRRFGRDRGVVGRLRNRQVVGEGLVAELGLAVAGLKRDLD